MALKFKTCKKQYLQWSVAIPGMDKSIESLPFHFEKSDWYFKLKTSLDYVNEEETWTLSLDKVLYSELPPKFLVTMSIRSSTDDYVFVVCREITTHRADIWTGNRHYFRDHHRGFEFSRNTLTLLLTFDCMISHTEDMFPVVENKSVQTSLYRENRLCLEKLSLDLQKIMDEGSNPDVQLRCGVYTVPAHKIILGARSEVFRTMLQSDMLEGREGTVEIVDMEPKIFVDFIRHLYTGVLPELNEESAIQLFEAADKYHLKDLGMECGDFLAENLTRDNVYEILVMADSHSDKILKEHAVSYMLREKIPCSNDNWSRFCIHNPKLANEVLTRGYTQLAGT